MQRPEAGDLPSAAGGRIQMWKRAILRQQRHRSDLVWVQQWPKADSEIQGLLEK